MATEPQNTRDKTSPAQLQAHHTSDHLANERTFLAWVRTSIAMIGLGFVVARFSLWLSELSARTDSPVKVRHSGLSLPIGIAMMAIGGFLAALALMRYRHVRRAINQNLPADGDMTMMTVTLMTMAIAGALIVYMLAAH